MLISRKAHCTIYLKGWVFCIGGFTDNGITNLCEKYDMNNNYWQQISNLIYARGYGSACVYDYSHIFIIGGFGAYEIDGNLELDRIERYDINRNCFDEFKLKLQYPVYGCVSAMVSESKIIVMGGFHTKNGDSDRVYTIDLSNGNFNYLTPLKTPGWTALPYCYKNGAFHLFCDGEFENGFPIHNVYSLNVPVY